MIDINSFSFPDEQVSYHYNHDITSVTTPINVREYGRLLRLTGYNRRKTAHLIKGFTYGFDLGYRGPTDRADSSNNLPLTVGNSTILWNKVMGEVELGRYAGPFEIPPYKTYMQSPIGLVPKANNKTRLIFHLSFDFGKEEKDKSLIFIHQKVCVQ